MNDTREYNEKIDTRVYDLLDYGREKAKSAKYIGARLDCSERDVQELVRQSRLAGIPICSLGKGYFRGSREDQIATYNLLKSRAVGALEVVRAFARAIWGKEEPDDEQISLDDLFDMTT